MAKLKTVYICQECGVEVSKWVGKCPSCNSWNSIIEHKISKSNKTNSLDSFSEKSIPRLISDIEIKNEHRLLSGINEFDRIIGGGFVPGSVILIGGEPGIGKSTLALQIALKMQNLKVLYISGEESEKQIKLRADRVIDSIKNNCFILSETVLENIIENLRSFKPDLLIIDSIQTLYSQNLESSAGTVTQVRECAAEILRFAKKTSTPAILIGHINKEGNIAGPKVLEHIVDTVLQFEGDQNNVFRILRTTKNRFGSTSELGIFEMRNTGLNEILNPSEILITQTDNNLSGTAIAGTINGIRPFLIEIQALVSSTVYSTPQRSSTGFDNRRLGMLLAVLEKRAGFKLAQKDVFLNIAGGIKVDDTGVDLAVIAAVLSSSLDFSVDKTICFSGEVGLTGEIRPVNRIEQRINEAEKLGFKKIFISKYNSKNVDLSKYNISIEYIRNVRELLKKLFSN